MFRTYFCIAILLLVSLVGSPSSARSSADLSLHRSYHLAQGGDVRSRSEVVQEVKERYNAKVLRINLSNDRSVYRVRILLPSGKVRDITIRAQR